MIPDQHLFSKLLAPTSSSFPLKLFTIISTLSPLQDLLPVTFCNPSKSLTTFKHQLKSGVIHSITMEWNTWISTSGGQLLHGQLLHGYSGVAATQITVNNGNNDKIDKMCHDYRREGFDSCNTVLAGSPRTIIDRLQRLLNASARVVSNTGNFDRGLTHLLHSELHWLDVPQQILHKLGVTVNRCLQGKAPQ